MRPQFPGMDPWLEQPTPWPDVRSRLVTAIADELAPRLAPRYFVGVGTRTTVVTGLDIDRVYQPDVTIHSAQRGGEPRGPGAAVLDPPEVSPLEVVLPIGEEIEETFVTIQELPGRKLVAVIEVRSPTNKKTKKPRAEYVEQRQNLIRAGVHFVEIDLLRYGESMPLINAAAPSDYRILICRRGHADRAVLHAFSWTVPIPAFSIPLLPGDAEPILDLNSVLHGLMDRAQYDAVINYDRPPEPSMRPEDEAWAAAIIARAADQTPEPTPGNGTAP